MTKYFFLTIHISASFILNTLNCNIIHAPVIKINAFTRTNNRRFKTDTLQRIEMACNTCSNYENKSKRFITVYIQNVHQMKKGCFSNH